MDPIRVAIVFLFHGMMIFKTNHIKATALHESCVKYIGNKCIHRRYVYNVGIARDHELEQQLASLDMEKLPPEALAIMQPEMTFNKSDGSSRLSPYNPSVGFEPYWADGNWVFATTTPDPNVTQTGQMCGDQCSPIYIRYGTICGRNKKRETRTFPNYCVMVEVDCLGVNGWYIAHRGKCRPEVVTYPTLPSSTVTPFYDRISSIFAGYSARHSKWVPTRQKLNITTPTSG